MIKDQIVFKIMEFFQFLEGFGDKSKMIGIVSSIMKFNSSSSLKYMDYIINITGF